jgi:hypothetical protein
MKVNGVKLRPPDSEFAVFERGEDRIVFECKPVLEKGLFDKLCPMPTAPTSVGKGGVAIPTPKDSNAYKNYQKLLTERQTKESAFLYIQSIKDCCEFEIVDPANPDTWGKLDEELSSAGLTNVEIMMLGQKVLEANRLSMTKIEQARERFLAEREAGKQEQLSSPQVEPKII